MAVNTHATSPALTNRAVRPGYLDTHAHTHHTHRMTPGRIGAAYLIPNVQVLCERVSSRRPCAIIWDLDDIVQVVQVHSIDNNHGQRGLRRQRRVYSGRCREEYRMLREWPGSNDGGCPSWLTGRKMFVEGMEYQEGRRMKEADVKIKKEQTKIKWAIPSIKANWYRSVVKTPAAPAPCSQIGRV